MAIHAKPARAAEAAAKSAEPLPVSSTAQLRDLAASAARVFGWDSGRDNGRSGDTHNTLIVTQEQLQQMRELCDADEPYKKPAVSEERKNNEH
jgi:Spy/CpxP family protein refolding chaperone